MTDNEADFINRELTENARQRAELFLRLGDIAAQTLPEIAEIEASKTDEDHLLEVIRRQEIREDALARTFFDALPTAELPHEAFGRDSFNDVVSIKSNDLKSALMASATAIWTTVQRFNDYDGQPAAWALQQYVAPRSLADIEDVRYSVAVPMLILGKKIVQANESKTDATVSALLVPMFTTEKANGRPSAYRALAVNSQLEKMNQLTTAGLAQPFTYDKYQSMRKDGVFIATAANSLRFARAPDPWEGKLFRGDKLPELPPEDPSLGAEEQPRKVRKLSQTVTSRGIVVQFEEPILLTAKTLREYNVNMYAPELAILFGAEDTYNQTIGALLDEKIVSEQ